MLIKRMSIIGVAVALTACATAQNNTKPVASEPGPLPNDQRYVMTRAGVEAARQERIAGNQPPAAVVPPKTYALPARAERTVAKAPAWFVNVPEDTDNATFAVGTATSSDEQMAYDKARMSAERKLVEQMYSRITTQTKSYRADRGSAMIENFEQVTRKNARGELSGAQRVDSQVTHDGQVYKVYVLLRLPVGEANVMQTRRDQARLQREAEIRGRAAERDMDANEARDQQRENDDLKALEQRLEPQGQTRPQSHVTPVVVPETVKTNQGEIKLLDVENPEYKAKRAEALAKPGAVIGQTTLR